MLVADLDRMPNFVTAEELREQGKRDAGIGASWSAADLLRAEFPPAPCVVPGLVPVGLTILAGRPKIGKSWMLLQLAIAVGTGGVALGKQVERKRVLYLALEDSPRRLKDRLQKLGCPSDAWITFKTEFPTLQRDGMAKLIDEIAEGAYALVIIDTYARFAAIRKAEDEQAAGQLMGQVQRYALEKGVALLVSDHHRKAAAGGVQDVIDDVSGNSVKTGVLDAVLGLYRQRGQANAELKVTGRDIEDAELSVRFDKQLACWQFVGHADDVRADSLQASIIDAMLNNFGGEATVSDISRFMGKAQPNIYAEMQELVAACRLSRMPKRGREVPYKVV
jgi:hypothetical protein